MSEIAGDFDNPFATRWTAPGKIDFLFPEGESVELLITRLSELDWRGAIVGPHGAGKSTLLVTLIARLRALGHDVRHVVLHRGERKLPSYVWKTEDDSQPALCERPARILAVDGWEQLRPWTRGLAAWRCRNRGFGLIVTCHRSLSLPTLCNVSPSLSQARRIVAFIANRHGAHVPDDVVDASYTDSDGDIREMLFSLYDWYERTNRSMRTVP